MNKTFIIILIIVLIIFLIAIGGAIFINYTQLINTKSSNITTKPKSCPTNCSNNGVCNTLTGECTCNYGYFGENCSISCPGSPDNICSGNGICSLDINTNNPVCNCRKGHFGENCSISYPIPLDTVSNNHICSLDTNTDKFICNCTNGYFGEDCSLICQNDFIYDNGECKQKYLSEINQYFRIDCNGYIATDVLPETNLDKKLFIEQLDPPIFCRITNTENAKFKLEKYTNDYTYKLKIIEDSDISDEVIFCILPGYNTFNLTTNTDILDNNKFYLSSIITKDQNYMLYIENNFQNNMENYNMFKSLRCNFLNDCLKKSINTPYNQRLDYFFNNLIEIVLPSKYNAPKRYVTNYIDAPYILTGYQRADGTRIITHICYLEDGTIILVFCDTDFTTGEISFIFRDLNNDNKYYETNQNLNFNNKYDININNSLLENISKITTNMNLQVKTYDSISNVQMMSIFNVNPSWQLIDVSKDPTTNQSINGKKRVYYLVDGDIILANLSDTSPYYLNLSRLGDDLSYYLDCPTTICSKFPNFNDLSNYTKFRESIGWNITSKGNMYQIKIFNMQ